MTLKPSQILDILNTKREDFSQFNQATLERLQQYQTKLQMLVMMPETERSKLLAKYPVNLGARPLESLGNTQKGVFSSGLQWGSREESLVWVRDRLTGITTFAVDGSQIYPGKDLSIPVALVQIGWFENPHLPGEPYTKDITVDVMTPQDLQMAGGGGPVDRRVNMRRFEMETLRLIEYMETHPQRDDVLLLFDGSLIATFAQMFEPATRQFYVHCCLNLLRASEQYRVPLVAFIDTTYADDVTRMLQMLFELPPADTVHDAQLFNRQMEWGDRTPLFRCERLDILEDYQEQKSRIVFTYLKTTRDNYPARLEMPLWMVEAGLAEAVLDWVRAEVIVGGGYPYAIETADQTAVLQVSDRQRFYELLQDWAEDQDLNLRLSRKMVSKARRR